MAYHSKTARNAACSWSPSTDVANRWLAVSLATSESSRLVKAPGCARSMVQVLSLFRSEPFGFSSAFAHLVAWHTIRLFWPELPCPEQSNSADVACSQTP